MAGVNEMYALMKVLHYYDYKYGNNRDMQLQDMVRTKRQNVIHLMGSYMRQIEVEIKSLQKHTGDKIAYDPSDKEEISCLASRYLTEDDKTKDDLEQRMKEYRIKHKNDPYQYNGDY
jgi:hypothetical protein